MPITRPIPVVCAVIEDGNGRVLLAQRPAHKHLGLKWEFAGGKVEAGETPESLASKIHTLEYRHYPEVIEKLLQAT